MFPRWIKRSKGGLRLRYRTLSVPSAEEILIEEAVDAWSRKDSSRMSAIATVFMKWATSPLREDLKSGIDNVRGYVKASICYAERYLTRKERAERARFTPSSDVIDTLARSGAEPVSTQAAAAERRATARLELAELRPRLENLSPASAVAMVLYSNGAPAKDIAAELNDDFGYRSVNGSEITDDAVRQWVSRGRKELAGDK